MNGNPFYVNVHMSFNKIYSQVILPISNQVLFFFDSIWRPPEDWRYQCWHLYGVGILKIYFYFVKNFTIINSCGNIKRLNSWKILNLLRPGAILTKLLMFKMSMNRQQKLGLILQSLQFIPIRFQSQKSIISFMQYTNGREYSKLKIQDFDT